MHETLSLWQAASLEATDWFKCLRGVMPINSLVSLLLAIEICINEGWIIKERGWITRDKTMSQEWELKRKELKRKIQSAETRSPKHSNIHSVPLTNSHVFPPHLPHFGTSKHLAGSEDVRSWCEGLQRDGNYFSMQVLQYSGVILFAVNDFTTE